MREEVGESPPRREKQKGASECFLTFALLHASCGDEVIEARLDKRALACWCLRCDELRIIGDPVGRDNGNLPGQGRVPRRIVHVSAFT
jgi:hypothetical protein